MVLKIAKGNDTNKQKKKLKRRGIYMGKKPSFTCDNSNGFNLNLTLIKLNLT